MADDNLNLNQPVFQIQRIYLKDLSLEQPNSPQILLEQAQPQVEINLNLGAEPVADGIYEVAVTATVTTKVGDKVLLPRRGQAGRHLRDPQHPDEQLQPIIGIACPGIVYPYLRAIVSDVCTRAGFPPVTLSEVNFQAMYERSAPRAEGAPASGNGSASSPRQVEPGAPMNLTVLGAGAWGTALAISASARHPTRLWARDPGKPRACARSPQFALPERDRCRPSLQISTDFETAIEFARGGLIVIATPMAACTRCCADAADAPGVLWLCKGFQEGTGWLGHEVAHRTCPTLRVGVLSGRAFAIEVACGCPTALVVASTDDSLCEEAWPRCTATTCGCTRPNDPIGVEVGGAVKNVLAIATGIADGMQLGLNAARRARDARPRRDDAPGPGAGRERRDLHGPERSR
jgi:protein-export chaperone SecB